MREIINLGSFKSWLFDFRIGSILVTDFRYDVVFSISKKLFFLGVFN